MQVMDYWRCVACSRGWCSKALQTDRVEFAQLQLELRPRPEDWNVVRFSDEGHCGWGPAGKSYVFRRPGERLRKDCIVIQPELKEEEKSECIAGVLLVISFKALYFINSGSKSGNMTPNVYVQDILEPVVKSWVECSDHFILEEERDWAHGLGRKSAAKQWKESREVEYYFSCRASPDLSPVENCWQPMKKYVNQWSYWDDESTRELCREGWNAIGIERINPRIHSMPNRLQRVIDMGGQYIGE